MILWTVSQISIGQFLSRAIRQQAINGPRPRGSTKVVHILVAIRAREWQMSSEADLNEVQILFQPFASIPEGLVAPSVHSAAKRMDLASMLSKMTG